MTPNAESPSSQKFTHQNFDDFPERLKQIIGDESQRSFAQNIGVTEGTLRAWLRRKSEPGMQNLISIAKYKNARIDWLAMSEGERFKPTKPDALKSAAEFGRDLADKYGLTKTLSEQAALGLLQPDRREEGDHDALSDFALIAFYDVEAAAGHGCWVDSEKKVGQMAFRKDWLRGKGLEPERLALIKARGDSMEPTLSDGDLLLIDTRVEKITDDSIYIIQADNHLIVKRIQQNLDGSLSIISDNNERYDKQFIDPERAKQIKIAGRVCWYGHEI
jgi:phage repressor protein C with HTH and peptisase S24 domain